MEEGYTIGQVASCSGVSVDTVRVYERQGLIDIPERRSNGYRHYSLNAIKRINFIKRTQTMGFSLKEINDILTIRRSSTHTCEEVCHQLESKLNVVEEKLKELQRLKNALESAIQNCHTTKDDHCPVLEALER